MQPLPTRHPLDVLGLQFLVPRPVASMLMGADGCCSPVHMEDIRLKEVGLPLLDASRVIKEWIPVSTSHEIYNYCWVVDALKYSPNVYMQCICEGSLLKEWCVGVVCDVGNEIFQQF